MCNIQDSSLCVLLCCNDLNSQHLTCLLTLGSMCVHSVCPAVLLLGDAEEHMSVPHSQTPRVPAGCSFLISRQQCTMRLWCHFSNCREPPEGHLGSYQVLQTRRKSQPVAASEICLSTAAAAPLTKLHLSSDSTTSTSAHDEKINTDDLLSEGEVGFTRLRCLLCRVFSQRMTDGLAA